MTQDFWEDLYQAVLRFQLTTIIHIIIYILFDGSSLQKKKATKISKSISSQKKLYSKLLVPALKIKTSSPTTACSQDEKKDILDDQSRPAGTRSFSFFPLQVPGNDYLSFLRFILPPLIVFHCLPTIITIISVCPFPKLKK